MAKHKKKKRRQCNPSETGCIIQQLNREVQEVRHRRQKLREEREAIHGRTSSEEKIENDQTQNSERKKSKDISQATHMETSYTDIVQSGEEKIESDQTLNSERKKSKDISQATHMETSYTDIVQSGVEKIESDQTLNSERKKSKDISQATHMETSYTDTVQSGEEEIESDQTLNSERKKSKDISQATHMETSYTDIVQSGEEKIESDQTLNSERKKSKDISQATHMETSYTDTVQSGEEEIESDQTLNSERKKSKDISQATHMETSYTDIVQSGEEEIERDQTLNSERKKSKDISQAMHMETSYTDIVQSAEEEIESDQTLNSERKKSKDISQAMHTETSYTDTVQSAEEKIESYQTQYSDNKRNERKEIKPNAKSPTEKVKKKKRKKSKDISQATHMETSYTDIVQSGEEEIESDQTLNSERKKSKDISQAMHMETSYTDTVQSAEEKIESYQTQYSDNERNERKEIKPNARSPTEKVKKKKRKKSKDISQATHMETSYTDIVQSGEEKIESDQTLNSERKKSKDISQATHMETSYTDTVQSGEEKIESDQTLNSERKKSKDISQATHMETSYTDTVQSGEEEIESDQTLNSERKKSKDISQAMHMETSYTDIVQSGEEEIESDQTLNSERKKSKDISQAMHMETSYTDIVQSGEEKIESDQTQYSDNEMNGRKEIKLNAKSPTEKVKKKKRKKSKDISQATHMETSYTNIVQSAEEKIESDQTQNSDNERNGRKEVKPNVKSPTEKVKKKKRKKSKDISQATHMETSYTDTVQSAEEKIESDQTQNSDNERNGQTEVKPNVKSPTEKVKKKKRKQSKGISQATHMETSYIDIVQSADEKIESDQTQNSDNEMNGQKETKPIFKSPTEKVKKKKRKKSKDISQATTMGTTCMHTVQSSEEENKGTERKMKDRKTENESENDDQNWSGTHVNGTFEESEHKKKKKKKKKHRKQEDSPIIKTPVQRVVQMQIPRTDWEKISVETTRKCRKLTRNWLSIFYAHFVKTNPSCPLTVRYNHVPKENTRKGYNSFFSGCAACTVKGCDVVVKFEMKYEPMENEPVIVTATNTGSQNIHHQINTRKGRPFQGQDRKAAKQFIEKVGPSNFYYESLGEIQQESLDAGNITYLGTKNVVQKMSSELKQSCRVHENPIVELELLKSVYITEDDTSQKILGHIQCISVSPFTVHIYSETQILLLCERIRSKTGRLYFDATGSVVSKMPASSKPVFYYPLLLKGVEKNPPVPVAEMLTDSHAVPDVLNFLARVYRACSTLKPGIPPPQQVEVDFSWTLINAVLLAFNKESPLSYLERAYKVVCDSATCEKKTVIHICSAHFLHTFSRRLVRANMEKKLRKFVLFCVAKLVNCQTFEQFKFLFRSICFVLLSKTGQEEEFASSLEMLQSKSVKHNVDEEQDIQEIENADEQETVVDRIKNSIFGQLCSEIKASVIEDTTDCEEVQNKYFCTEAVGILLSFSSTAPFWSGFILSHADKPENVIMPAHDTNSAAENWMKIVKVDILQGKKRLRPSDFIIKVNATKKGRLREYGKTGRDIPHDNKRGTKRKVEESSYVNEEKWKPKKKMKKGLYFNNSGPPPSPKKSRQKSQKMTKKTLHWGGTVTVGGKQIVLSNTCPVDNLLVFICKVIQENSSIFNWFVEHIHVPICNTILDIVGMFNVGRYSDARNTWLQRCCGFSAKAATWNVWGSEGERFVLPYSEIQESITRSACSNDACPVKDKHSSTREICLAQDPDNEEIDLQHSVDLWATAAPVLCNGSCGSGNCQGLRSWRERRFVYNDPPILLVSVSFLSNWLHLTGRHLPAELMVLGKRYHIWGFTCSTRSGGHFVGYFKEKTSKSWFRYDGLKTPEICKIIKDSTIDKCAKIEHLILVIEN